MSVLQWIYHFFQWKIHHWFLLLKILICMLSARCQVQMFIDKVIFNRNLSWCLAFKRKFNHTVLQDALTNIWLILSRRTILWTLQWVALQATKKPPLKLMILMLAMERLQCWCQTKLERNSLLFQWMFLMPLHERKKLRGSESSCSVCLEMLMIMSSLIYLGAHFSENSTMNYFHLRWINWFGFIMCILINLTRISVWNFSWFPVVVPSSEYWVAGCRWSTW